MNPELKKRWVEALRSGMYRQGTNLLYNRHDERYCCLGVLHLCAGYKPESIDHHTFGWSPALIGHAQIADELAKLNDEGVPFEMIAGLIDQSDL